MFSTVKKWNDASGYGFIVNPDGGKDIFVHHSNIIGRPQGGRDGSRKKKNLAEGQSVEFEISENEKGLNALNVVPH